MDYILAPLLNRKYLLNDIVIFLSNTNLISATIFFLSSQFPDCPDEEVEDLHPADEGEAGEEPHGAPDGGQLVHKLGCSVLLGVLQLLSVHFTYLGNPVEG